jgi:hypothetical protein
MSDGRKLFLAVLLGACIGGLVTLLMQDARPQGIEPLEPAGSSGFAISPDGTTSSWGSDGGGYSIGPGVTSSWGPSGGYMIEPDGTYSTWTGPQVPLMLPDGSVILVPGSGE